MSENLFLLCLVLGMSTLFCITLVFTHDHPKYNIVCDGGVEEAVEKCKEYTGVATCIDFIVHTKCKKELVK